MRARYIEWQSKRNHGKRRQQPIADTDYHDHVTPIITLAYHTGFDIGDIFDLDWEHVDFPNNQIRKIRNKTKHKADLKDFRLKDLRHTFASWLAINGIDIMQIRDLLGHSDVKTTQIYAHLCPRQKEKAVMAVFS